MLRIVVAFLFLSSAFAGPPTAPVLPRAAQASANFDPTAATNAWLASVPAAARARSDAYFEGGYWLILWDFLYGLAVACLLLETGLSARIRDAVERTTSSSFFRIFGYWLVFVLVTTILTLPLTLYEGFFREHQYGLSNQTLGQWLGEQALGFAIGAVTGGLAVTALFACVRRLPRTWHLWGAAITIGFLIVVIVAGPVLVAPLFNTYRPLADAGLKNRILSLAHASGIPASDVYENDASRQSNRVSANVSGLFGTERITLNDNLLKRCSPDAILSTMGHEMGHYVLHHIYNAVMFLSLVTILCFALLRWGLEVSLKNWGSRWAIRGIGDVAVIPLAMILLLCMSFLFTPIDNSFIRAQEYEADLYGLNAARQPDGEAEVDLLLGEYRKLDPGPMEEILFFDHPSGRTRIHAAMRWKAENLCLFNSSLPCYGSTVH